MRRSLNLLFILGVCLCLPEPLLAQPRPQMLPLHTAEAGASANGATVPAFGYEAVAVQNTIAAAWDGTLTYEVTTDNSNWTAVNCRNALSSATASTTVAAAGYVVCPVTGAQGFRARVSGRTVGTVTAVAALIAQSGSGVGATVPPVGAAATQVQGTAADGAAAVGNPVQIGGKDGAGNIQTLSTDTSGRLDVNQGTAGAGSTGWSVAPVQGTTLANTSTTGAVNTAVVTTITGAASTRAHLRSVSAFCSAGSATLTIQDGATTIWTTPAGFVGTVKTSLTWPTPLAATTAANLVVTLGACGGGNTGTLDVQADRF